ncbi:hypothetical protein D3093_15150 (plasmid) [Azospirillum argentinense]|uniref:Uncharacterized protein n=1 Tax=Azospirillum argentinense TaxID=2970906 RepID=A0A4D8PLZ7_9PROT|nr:hypothetical protein [Azospirillum argentinense]QCN96675.1 hypothetical protein D3093_15150 [Azospirillum argentinense]
MYQTLPEPGFVLRLADHAVIPPSEGNIDYQAYLAWVGTGNMATPFEPPAASTPVPASISDRQFFQQMAVDGYISQAEALAAVKTGNVPAILLALIADMPSGERFAAEMLLSGATTYERAHPLSVAIGEARGLTPEEVDAFFQAAAKL